MNRLYFHLFTILFCLSFSFLRDPSLTLLTFFLLSIIATLYNYIRSKTAVPLLLCLILLSFGIFKSEMLLFYPILLFPFFIDIKSIPCGGWLSYNKLFAAYIFIGAGTFVRLIVKPDTEFISSFSISSLFLAFYILSGCLLSLLFALTYNRFETLKNLYRKNRDDSTELALLLKERNQTLLAKQDYEIYAATLRERNRIAREIHDNLGHSLTRSILITGSLKITNHDETLVSQLEVLDETLNSAMTNIRNSVHDMHDESINLKEVIATLVTDFIFCPIDYSYDCTYNIPTNVTFCFISIIKEAFSNCIKHSNATKISLSVREHPGLFQLVIKDNGNPLGLTEKELEEKGNGIGLRNMLERVQALNGYLRIDTQNGFFIFVTIPKNIKEES